MWLFESAGHMRMGIFEVRIMVPSSWAVLRAIRLVDTALDDVWCERCWMGAFAPFFFENI